MYYDGWLSGYKVEMSPWIDKKHIYLNVAYYAPVQSIEREPVWDNTVYITDNEAGRHMLENFLDTLVNHVAKMNIKEGAKVVLTV